MSCPPKYEVFCCDQNGPPARRSEPDWRMEGAYLNRYVTDEQRSRRPIFIATLWAGASWLFFRVARSTRITKMWALRSRLEKQPTDLRQNTSYFGDRTLVVMGIASHYWRAHLIAIACEKLFTIQQLTPGMGILALIFYGKANQGAN